MCFSLSRKLPIWKVKKRPSGHQWQCASLVSTKCRVNISGKIKKEINSTPLIGICLECMICSFLNYVFLFSYFNAFLLIVCFFCVCFIYLFFRPQASINFICIENVLHSFLCIIIRILIQFSLFVSNHSLKTDRITGTWVEFNGLAVMADVVFYIAGNVSLMVFIQQECAVRVSQLCKSA